MREISIYPDTDTLAQKAAEMFVDTAGESIRDHGRFMVALSGGSTPNKMYAILATRNHTDKIEWENVHIFWGDERCVPPDHPDNNFRMARQAFLDHIPIPPGNIHRIPGELEPHSAAEMYARDLRTSFMLQGNDPPRFDLIFLGMGTDGHTASLFPNTTAVNDQKNLVAANFVPKLEAWRITLTARTINAAANVVFLASGSDKSQTLERVLNGPRKPRFFPSQLIDPTSGKLLWMLDADAAASL
jgi:6-phosphogluconolactonase